jgi:hypothetical protein
VSRAARGHVIRPIRIFGAVAVAGAVAAVLALAGLPIPRAVLAMTAAVALGFAVNDRPTRRSRRGGLGRAAWLVAAALMFAALPSRTPVGAGAFGLSVSMLDLAALAVIVVLFGAALIKMARGVWADRGDRLLVAALAGTIAFAALFVVELQPPAWWLYPFAVLLGAALERANGNLRVP